MKRISGENRIKPRYATVKEFSQYTGLSIPAVYHLVARRQIPAKRIGRRLLFDLTEVDAALESIPKSTGENKEWV
jgi:excisionase family DNA binding protein